MVETIYNHSLEGGGGGGKSNTLLFFKEHITSVSGVKYYIKFDVHIKLFFLNTIIISDSKEMNKFYHDSLIYLFYSTNP